MVDAPRYSQRVVAQRRALRASATQQQRASGDAGRWSSSGAGRASSSGVSTKSTGGDAAHASRSRCPPRSSIMNSTSPCARAVRRHPSAARDLGGLRRALHAPSTACRRARASAPTPPPRRTARSAPRQRTAAPRQRRRRATRLHADVDAVVRLEERRVRVVWRRAQRQRERQACDALLQPSRGRHLRRSQRVRGAGRAAQRVAHARDSHAPPPPHSAATRGARSGKTLQTRPPRAR